MKLKNFILIFSILIVPCIASNGSYVNYYLDEVRSLSELPLEKLIQIKSSFAKRNSDDDYEIVAESRSSSALAIPMALPLRRTSNKPIRRYEEWDEKGKDSKISKIFQLTVTALSFLAFGGYLLTLIITAIRRNQNTGNQQNVIVLSNLQSLQKIKRPKRSFIIYDPTENDFGPERLYRGMIMLSSDFGQHFH